MLLMYLEGVFMEKLFNLILQIKKLFDEENENKKDFFKNYIEPTYCQGKQIYLDLIEILQQTQNMLLDEGIDSNTVIKYLKKARLPFQYLREELRSRTFLITNKVQRDTDLYVFAIAIRGILCGGMTGEFYQFNMDMIDKYVKGLSIEEELCFYEGKHTLLNLIESFDIENGEYNGEQLNIISHNQKKFKQIFLNEVQKQTMSLEQYFKLLTNAYEKIKWEIYSRNI